MSTCLYSSVLNSPVLNSSVLNSDVSKRSDASLSSPLIVISDNSNIASAQDFAQQHGLPFEALEGFDFKTERYQFALSYEADALCLQTLGPKAPGPITASFLQGKVKHRQQFGGGQGQLIAKAVGLKSGIRPRVLDATAGLGRDAFVLASLGCEVTMLESAPWVAALLEHALQQANLADDEPDVQQVVARMDLVKVDAKSWLQALPEAERVDVIYLDPMYPHREKSALVKKEMRAFHELLGSAQDDTELLAAALEKARYRVVVKRPRKGERIAGEEPNLVLNGKSCRYDIYTKASMSALKV